MTQLRVSLVARASLTAWIALFLMLSSALPAAESNSAGAGERIPVSTDRPELRQLFREGIGYIDSWRLEKSLPIFERIVEIDPDWPLGWFGLAWSQPRFKDMFEYADRALALLDEVEVSSGEELMIRAFHASVNSDPAGWRSHTEALVEQHPNDPRALVLLGNVHAFSLNDREGALDLYRRATELDPTFVRGWQGVATMESLLGRREASGEAIERLLEQAPDDPRAHDSMAVHHLEGGDLDEALRHYRRALEIEPLFESSEQGLVTVWMLRGEHEKARRHLRQIYEQAPLDGYRSGLHFALAVVYADEGNLDGAEKELRNNLALSATIHDSLAMAIDLNNLIDVLLAAGQLDEAADANEQLLRHITDDPEQPEARKNVTRATNLLREGRIALHRGDLATAHARADEFARRAEELGHPWMQPVSFQLPGEIALAEGRWGDAIRHLEASNPHSARNMFRIAQAHRGQGDEEGYRRMLQYVVDYRGVLNLGYALIRRDAEQRLAGKTPTRPGPRVEPSPELERLKFQVGRWHTASTSFRPTGQVAAVRIGAAEITLEQEGQLLRHRFFVQGLDEPAVRIWQFWDRYEKRLMDASFDLVGHFEVREECDNEGQLCFQFAEKKAFQDGVPRNWRKTYSEVTGDSYLVTWEWTEDDVSWTKIFDIRYRRIE